MSASVVITPQEVVELRHGLKQLKGTVKNARRLDSALERRSEDLDELLDPQKDLLNQIQALPVDGAKDFRIGRPALKVARIAARLRHGKVAKQVETAEQIELAHDDAAEQLRSIESLGRKLGVQLDLVDHGDAEDDGDDESED